MLFNVYPNFVITVGPNCAVFLILLPETPETVNIKMGILVQEGPTICRKPRPISISRTSSTPKTG